MGFGTIGCVVFCYLNGCVAWLIGYCFDAGISSMAITASINQWDLSTKARACRHASIMYFLVAAALHMKSYVDDRREQAAEQSVVGTARDSHYAWDCELFREESSPLLSNHSTDRLMSCEPTDKTTREGVPMALPYVGASAVPPPRHPVARTTARRCSYSPPPHHQDDL